MSARIIQFGGELCILSISRDISERKAAEAALHESEENYRVLVENSPDFIARFDTSTRIIFANTAVLRELEHTHGLREDQIIGRTYREMGLSPELCNFCEEKIRAVSASGQAYETEYAYESGPKRMHVNWRLIPELDEQGRTKSILSLSRDITEQKRLEAASRKAEVLSAELKKEKEIIALKERFISTVSHEFRAPLSVIKTSSDLLDRYLDKLPVERRQKLIQQIGQQIEHMTDLIDDTLDLTRAQAGKTEFSPTWLDLEPFCRALFDQTMFANDCRHQFEYVSHAPAEAVWVDGRLLRHILTNLLSNAIKYTPDNAKIRFELDHTADTVIFRITDEGIGIPEKDQGRLFEPFHRAENAGNIKGTGLGLAIVKQYVEVHRGRIDVDSQEGLGSTFSVYLPRT
jgi:PAS domain S-box-containing protein